ncbi:hypothetical protein DENSPDRAFT_872515 [Dentipellis sp. KUC8613]|nr:hypothetical protein DENSPDRAFT_872515 [Dentipellis sp. KUC8613]
MQLPTRNSSACPYRDSPTSTYLPSDTEMYAEPAHGDFTLAERISDSSLLHLVRGVSANISRNARTYLSSNQDASAVESMLEIERQLAKASLEFAKVMNAFRTINRLPPEILATIFSFVGYGIPVVTLSQVALQTPCLWTLYNTCEREAYLPVFLQRSGAAPFTVQSVLNPEDACLPKNILPLICSNLGRMRTLSVVCAAAGPDIESYVAGIVQKATSPATALLRLSVKSYTRLDGSVFAPVFGGIMPVLKHLCLCYVSIWPQSIVPSLQSLSLTHSATPLDTFLDALEVLQNLQKLAMTAVELTHNGQLPAKRSISAPHLHLLRLDVPPPSFRNYAHILACLAPAKPVSTYLVIQPRHAPMTVFGAARPEPLNLFTALTKLKLEVSDRYTSFTASNAAASAFVSFHLSAASVPAALTPAGILMHPGVLLPTEHIASLAVADEIDINLRGGHTIWPVPVWAALLRGTPRLRALAFDCMCPIARPALAALAADPHTCAPALARITYASGFVVPGTAGLDQLVDFARPRPALRCVRFRSAELADKAREMLSGVVEDVGALRPMEDPEESVIPIPRCFWDEPWKHEFLV